MLNISIDCDVKDPDGDLVNTVGLGPFVLLTLYEYVMLIFGTFGNSLILYASIQFSAIDLGRVSLVFLKNVAVVDIVWTLATTLTICISNTGSNRWYLGKAVCGTVAYLRYPLSAVQLLLISLVSCHRIYTITWALRVNSFTTRHARRLAALAWFLPSSVLLVSVVRGVDVKFDPLLATCVSQIIYDRDTSTRISVLCLFIVLGILPFTLTIFSNLCMLFYAIQLSRKRANASFKRAFFTVFAICGVFVAISLPNMFRIILPMTNRDAPAALTILSGQLYLLNSSCNSIILGITNRRFRTLFFRRFFNCNVRFLGHCMTEGEENSVDFYSNTITRKNAMVLVTHHRVSVTLTTVNSRQNLREGLPISISPSSPTLSSRSRSPTSVLSTMSIVSVHSRSRRGSIRNRGCWSPKLLAADSRPHLMPNNLGNGSGRRNSCPRM